MRDSQTHSLVTALQEVTDFAELDTGNLIQAVGKSANLLWSAGSVIFECGDPADAVYVVLSGRVRISTGEEDDDTIAEVGPCDYFGEQAALLRTTHSASAMAVEDCELMVIPKEYFKGLLDADAEAADRVRRRVEHRLAERRGHHTAE